MVVWRGRPRPRSIAQTLSYLLSGQPRDPDNLIPAGLAGSNSNGRTRHIQKFRKEFDAGLVCFAVYRRGGERDLEGVAHLASNCVFLRARMDLDCERSSRL